MSCLSWGQKQTIWALYNENQFTVEYSGNTEATVPRWDFCNMMLLNRMNCMILRIHFITEKYGNKRIVFLHIHYCKGEITVYLPNINSHRQRSEQGKTNTIRGKNGEYAEHKWWKMNHVAAKKSLYCICDNFLLKVHIVKGDIKVKLNLQWILIYCLAINTCWLFVFFTSDRSTFKLIFWSL